MTPGEAAWRAFGGSLAELNGWKYNEAPWELVPPLTQQAWEIAAEAAIQAAIEEEALEMEALLATAGFRIAEDGHIHDTGEWGCECWGAEEEGLEFVDLGDTH